MKKMLFVVNPYAGTRKINKVLSDIIGIFNRAQYQVITYMTASQGDCREAVKKWADGMDLVVCAGGDGTFNETVNGLMERGLDIPVGYIPCGSTNDFAASLKISTNLLQAAKDIVEGSPEPFDIGQFNQRYFTYVASFGAFTRTSYSTSQTIKNALGHMAYLLEGIQELSQIRKEHIRIRWDEGELEDDYIFGAVCNSTSVGGVLTLDPKQVDMCDGLFEVLLVRSPKDLLEVGDCLRALQRHKYNCAMMTFFSASKLEIDASEKMPWALDGEMEKGHSNVTIQNLHSRIRLMKRKTE